MQSQVLSRSFLYVTVALSLCASVARGQEAAARIRVLGVKKSAMQQELSRLATDGYLIVLADVQPGIVVAYRSGPSADAQYAFVDNLTTRFQGGALEPGFRLLRETFSADGAVFSGVFEKAEGENRAREYVIVDAGSPGDLEKKARALSADGLSPVAIEAGDRVAAIFERRPDAQPWKIVATARTGTLNDEVNALAAQGYRIVDGIGGNELVYVLAKSTDTSPAEYRLLSTTKSTTLERELNAAAAEGFRFVPSSLAALSGGGSLLRMRPSNETVAIVQRTAAADPIVYKAIGARRVTTLEKELSQAAAEGFAAVAAIAGFEEMVVVLERSSNTR